MSLKCFAYQKHYRENESCLKENTKSKLVSVCIMNLESFLIKLYYIFYRNTQVRTLNFTSLASKIWLVIGSATYAAWFTKAVNAFGSLWLKWDLQMLSNFKYQANNFFSNLFYPLIFLIFCEIVFWLTIVTAGLDPIPFPWERRMQPTWDILSKKYILVLQIN